MHYEVELGIVVRGKLRCDFHDRSLTLGSGQTWLSGIWEPHRMYALNAPCTVALLVVWPDMAALLKPPEGAPHFWMAPFLAPLVARLRASAHRLADMIGIAERIGQALSRPPDVARVWLQLCLMEALLRIAEGWDWKPASDPGGVKPGDVRPAVELVFRSSRFVTTSEGARVCGLGRNLFSRRFRTLFGIPFPDFALRHRLSGAADDLLQEDLPVKAVAAKWGFRDVSHFHRAFVRFFACRPGAYRAAVRK
jgi:AraC-like DNA-binding protein